MSRIVAAVLLATAALAGALAGASTAAGAEASWRFAPVLPPPAPEGTEATGADPVPLGHIGEISFWAPNHGLLITGGSGSSCAESANALIPCGLFAYNGTGWHLLSTVCGGAEGRIAWAGPDEFWTIADQRPGQAVLSAGGYGNISLCHFAVGEEGGRQALQVVGSYALPLEQPDSYLPMDAAACLSPEDCWFGGQLGRAPNRGAFHLHWDGSSISVVYSPQVHAIASMAVYRPGVLFESVALGPLDSYSGEDPAHPYLLHQLDAAGSDEQIAGVLMPNAACATLTFCPPLPDYGFDAKGEAVAPGTLTGLSLASDYLPGVPEPAHPQLWAVAGAVRKPETKPGEGVAHPIVLRYSEGAWTQVVGGPDPGGDDPFGTAEQPDGVAPEPGVAAAWVTLAPYPGSTAQNEAHVAHVSAAGKISEEALGSAQGVGARGPAGAIACPAPEDCWLATTHGWLFHYTNSHEPPPDEDPDFAGVVTFRPADGGVPVLPSIEPPPDDSLANQLPPPPPPPPAAQPQQTLQRKPLVTDMRARVTRSHTLELSFRLTVKAHVQLLANHGRSQVARTPRETLRAGRHVLALQLDPKRWPTKLKLNATPLEPLPTVAVSPTSGNGQTVAPPTSANTVGT
jgi:hypothetical protein